mgnify:CR=1 FL=1
MKISFLDNHTFVVICLILSVIRVVLEVIKFDFSKLPITRRLPKNFDNKFHKWGLYFSVGYLILFSPGFLFS